MRLADGDWVPTGEDLVVVVEPCYGGVAVASALDAGWSSVEIAEVTSDAPPIPLVSFEQPVPLEQRGDESRCRVRSRDLEATLERLTEHDATPVLATPANARPAMSSLARACEHIARVTFVPAEHVAVFDDGRPSDSMTVDGIWAAGMLIRVLLEELDGERPVWLADGAGVAVTVAQGAEDASQQLAAGSRWRDHVDSGGCTDDLRVAAAVDSIGAVPLVRFDDVEGTLVARPWLVPA